MYCTMVFYFNRVGIISRDELKESIKEINDLCHTNYKSFEIIMDSSLTTNSIYSKIKKLEQINDKDESLINEVYSDKTGLMLFLANYNDSESVCERITIRFCNPSIKMASNASVSYRINNIAKSALCDYKRVLKVFYRIGWRIDNSFACYHNSPNFPFALNGIHYSVFNSKETKNAIEHERKHFHRNYVGSIQDVYQANTISMNHLSEEKLKMLEEICGKKCEIVEDNFYFDCLARGDSLQIDKAKRKRLRELF